MIINYVLLNTHVELLRVYTRAYFLLRFVTNLRERFSKNMMSLTLFEYTNLQYFVLMPILPEREETRRIGYYARSNMGVFRDACEMNLCRADS